MCIVNMDSQKHIDSWVVEQGVYDMIRIDSDSDTYVLRIMA